MLHNRRGHGHGHGPPPSSANAGSGILPSARPDTSSPTQSPSPRATANQSPSRSTSPSPSPTPSTQPQRRRSSSSLARKLSHSLHSQSHSQSRTVPLQDGDALQRHPFLTVTRATRTTEAEAEADSHTSKDKSTFSLSNMRSSLAKMMGISDKDKDKSKDKPQRMTRPAGKDLDSFAHAAAAAPATQTRGSDAIHGQPSRAADPGPPPPMTAFSHPPQACPQSEDDQDLDFESSLDINISTLTSSLSMALARLSAFTQSLVCDRDLDLPHERRLASTLAHHLVAKDLPSKRLPYFSSLPPPCRAVRPKDAATYLTSILARHFLFKLSQSMPKLASGAATRAAAREVTYHFLHADALGAMHVPLPQFWAKEISDLCESVESILVKQFSFSVSLFTADDRERVQHAARACALATAMMRVVHPHLSYAWVRPGISATEDSVRSPVEEWVGARPSDAAKGVRVAYCVFPEVDESETGLEKAGIWKAVVAGYVESDPQMQTQTQTQQQQQQAPVPQPIIVQDLPPRTSSKAPTQPATLDQRPRLTQVAPAVAQKQLAQAPTTAALHHTSTRHADEYILPLPPTAPHHQQQLQQRYHTHQPTDISPTYKALDSLAPPPTTTVALVDDRDDTDEPVFDNPLTPAFHEDSDDEQDARERDHAMVISALNQSVIAQTSLYAASAAVEAASPAADDGDACVEFFM